MSLKEDEEIIQRELEENVLVLCVALTEWIPFRKETVKRMERVADEINTIGKITNGVKIGGSVVSVASGVLALFSTAGLATPIVIGVTVCGVVGAIASGGAEMAKKVEFSKNFEGAQSKIDEETDEYQTLIHELSKMGEKIEELERMIKHKEHKPYWDWLSRTGIIEFVTSYKMRSHRILGVVSVTTSVAAGKYVMKRGTVKVAGLTAGEVTAVAGGKAASRSLGKSIGRLVPFLNLGFAAWDTNEAVKAGLEISTGSETESIVRANVEELKKEANRIVTIMQQN